MSENETPVNNEEPLFEEYLEKEDGGIAGFFKSPRGWLVTFGIIVAIVLLVMFYKSVVLGTWTSEEVKNSIEVTWQDTKWVDKETTPYGVKIVPSTTFKIKNIGPKPLQYVSFEGVFEFADTGKVQSDGGIHAFKQPLMPGEESGELFIKAFFGTKASSKAAFFQNKSEWKKMKVKLFARTKGSVPVQIGESVPVKQIIDGYNHETGILDPQTPNVDKAKLKESFEKIGKALQIAGQDSIWVDRLRTPGKAIIVPSIHFQVKNVGKETLEDVFFKGEFYFSDNGEKLGEGIAKDPLKTINAGDTSNDITLRSGLGYEATSKEAFIKNNKTWRKVNVKIFARQKDLEYVHLGTYSIRQKIEGVKVVYEFKQ